ncbi:MAG TPA: hypothetical protein PK910_04475 [Bacteroidales bacterium]|nr:hypothetical protein [Bacteroidales bacterium]HCI54643.1 hypothetical protein [Bacteroidales bacterium]HRC89258.1 hypothetical protein [Bacteroidales bacterium]
MEETKKTSAHAIGTAALITGIITFVLAVIPCVGIIAIIPGIITIVLAVIGLTQASRDNSPLTLLISSLVIGIVAFLISFSQIFVTTRLVRHTDKLPREIRETIKDIHDEVVKDLEESKVNIRIESNGEVVEIQTGTDNKEIKLKQLEELEKTDKTKTDSLPEK